MYKFIIRKIPLLLAVTLIFGFIYVAVQQVLRQSANDPQIQIAEDTANELDAGRNVSDFNNSGKVDIAKSLALFILIYDTNGKVVAGTGELHGVLPTLPIGVFEAAKNSGEDRVTWQPEAGVRSALVVVPYSGGVVAVGRSLREVEARESALSFSVLVAWAVTLIAIALSGFILNSALFTLE